MGDFYKKAIDRAAVSAKYQAKTTLTGSRIEIVCEDLPVSLNQMIVWIMSKPEQAAHLLGDYYRVRDDEQDREEGSAKNHGWEP